ncbi:MAG TPA: ROK family protein [Candidatus Copromorpha excrementigallinarum]|uniref:ROK family protein n=1 Tax=Candidatus Allocopromorpha excrementigallinarum TaxID=2840742 RepID=A0A9D1I1V0_9FIRM|nr:ROK family protein [Candidatus Copromorpha excrementigallinarum]
MAEGKPIINNTVLVKQTNVELVRSVLRRRKTATRAEVASDTGLSVVTSGTILNEMLASGELLPDKMEESNGGRPARRFRYNKDFIQVAGIAISYDLSVKSLQYIVADAFGEVIEEDRAEYDSIDFSTVDGIIKEIASKYANLKSVVISIPGESYDGIVRFCDIKELQGAPLERDLPGRYGITVNVDGITQVAAYGYYNSNPHLQGKSIAVLLAPKDLHLGAGIIVNGQLTKGDKHLAGEVSFIAGGISREEALSRIPDRRFLLNSMVTALTAIISVINPTQIAIYGSAVSADMYDQIYEKCNDIVPTVFMPEIKIIPDFEDYFIKGLTGLALESTNSGLKLVGQEL